MLISIFVCVCITGNDYHISVYNYIFNYLLRNILIYFQNVRLFLFIGGQSRWEDKVTATKIRGSFDTHEDPPERVFKSGLIMLISNVFFGVYYWE